MINRVINQRFFRNNVLQKLFNDDNIRKDGVEILDWGMSEGFFFLNVYIL